MENQNNGQKNVSYSGTACCVSGCSCSQYSQPDTGHKCKTCGHYSGKHTC